MKKEGEFEVYGIYHIYECENWDSDANVYADEVEELVKVVLLNEEQKAQMLDILNDFVPVMYDDTPDEGLHCFRYILRKLDAGIGVTYNLKGKTPMWLVEKIINNIEDVKPAPDWRKDAT